MTKPPSVRGRKQTVKVADAVASAVTATSLRASNNPNPSPFTPVTTATILIVLYAAMALLLAGMLWRAPPAVSRSRFT